MVEVMTLAHTLSAMIDYLWMICIADVKEWRIGPAMKIAGNDDMPFRANEVAD